MVWKLVGVRCLVRNRTIDPDRRDEVAALAAELRRSADVLPPASEMRAARALADALTVQVRAARALADAWPTADERSARADMWPSADEIRAARALADAISAQVRASRALIDALPLASELEALADALTATLAHDLRRRKQEPAPPAPSTSAQPASPGQAKKVRISAAEVRAAKSAIDRLSSSHGLETVRAWPAEELERVRTLAHKLPSAEAVEAFGRLVDEWPYVDGEERGLIDLLAVGWPSGAEVEDLRYLVDKWLSAGWMVELQRLVNTLPSADEVNVLRRLVHVLDG